MVRPAALAGLVLGGLVAGSMLAPILARADGGDSDDGTEKQISVLVIGQTPSPTPSPTGSPSATASASPSASATSSSSSAPTRTPSTSPAPTGRPPHGGGDAKGALVVSDLHCVYRFSFNPFGGSMELSFTVRNEYARSLDGSARFWLTNVFGGQIGTPVQVAVPGLKPQETRAVSASIEGVAQWTFLTAHATFTPPPGFGGRVVLTVVREARPFVLPWAVVSGGAVCAAGFGGRRLWLRAFHRPSVTKTLTATEEVES